MTICNCSQYERHGVSYKCVSHNYYCIYMEQKQPTAKIHTEINSFLIPFRYDCDFIHIYGIMITIANESDLT